MFYINFYTFLTCISPSLNTALLIPLRCLHPGTFPLALRVGEQMFLPETDTHLTCALVWWWICCITRTGALLFLALGFLWDSGVAAVTLASQPGRVLFETCTCENCATETSCPLCFRESKEQGLVPKAVFIEGKGGGNVEFLLKIYLCCRPLQRQCNKCKR